MKMRVLTSLLLGSAIVVSGAFGTRVQAQPAPFEINTILSMTGPGAFLGKVESTSLGILEQYINKEGGIKGRPVKFTISDDQSNPAVAVQLLNGIIAKKVSVVLGSSIAATCNAMASVITAGPVVYCLSGGVQPVRGSYMFAIGSNLVLHVPVSIRYMREKGWKKLALLSTTDASGKDGERLTDLALATPENKDVQVVVREYFNLGDVSAAAQISKIKASGAQAILVWAIGANAATAFRGLQDAGIDLPVLTTGANAIVGQMKQFQTFLPKELLIGIPPATLYDDLPPGRTKQAVGVFANAVRGAGLELDVPLATAWDPALILVSALRTLGTDAPPDKIRDYINNLRGWAGASGEYDFRDGSQLGLNQNTVMVTHWDPTRQAFVAVSKLGGMPR